MRYEKKRGLVLILVLLLTVSLCPIETLQDNRTIKASASNTASAAEIAAKKAEYDAAMALYNKGSVGFFEYCGATAAASTIRNAKYAASTTIGDSKDATSIVNMQGAVEFVERCNSLRAGQGKPELLITHNMMAIAQSNLNWSATNMSHSQQFNVAENLSWGYSDPFSGWYTEEKAEYDAGNTSFGKTGHYQNIVNESYKVTGFAMNQKGQYNKSHGQTFYFNAGNSSDGSDTAYTVAEYRSLLQGFISYVEEAKKAYELLQQTTTEDEQTTQQTTTEDEQTTQQTTTEDKQTSQQVTTGDTQSSQQGTTKGTQSTQQVTTENMQSKTEDKPDAVSSGKPVKTSIKSLKAASKKLMVKWRKKSGIQGYQLQCAKNKGFKGKVYTVTIKSRKAGSTTIRGLKKHTTYYVRIRTYKKVNGQKQYSGWSKVKKKKTK